MNKQKNDFCGYFDYLNVGMMVFDLFILCFSSKSNTILSCLSIIELFTSLSKLNKLLRIRGRNCGGVVG